MWAREISKEFQSLHLMAAGVKKVSTCMQKLAFLVLFYAGKTKSSNSFMGNHISW